MKTSDSARLARRGFTLLELVISIAIVSILAAAVVPVATRALNYEGRKATRAELERLAQAALDYFHDTGQVPSSETRLESNPGVSGWAGPYLTGAVPDAATGKSQWQVDAWSRDYVFTAGSTLTISSAGADASTGTSDDLSVVVDFTPVRRARTLEELAILNQAITLYNATWMSSAPLPLDWSSARALLVSHGYLPDDTAWDADAWGVPYTADPPGVTPVVRLRSDSL